MSRLTAADDVGVVRGAGVVPAAGALPVVAVVGAVAGVVCVFSCILLVVEFKVRNEQM